jgi:hypothetical protein
MLSLQSNPVLLSIAEAARTAAYVESKRVDADVKRGVARIVMNLARRRARRWDKVLGYRADGHAIRPCPEYNYRTRFALSGRRFRFEPILSASALEDVADLVRQEVEGQGREEWCGSDCRRKTRARMYVHEDKRGPSYVFCPNCAALAASVEAHPESQFHSFEDYAEAMSC